MIRPIARSFHLLAASFLFAAVAACSGPKKLELGAACALNSDCVDPLSCKLGRCHRTCIESRDCDPGQRCVRVEAGAICQLDVEKACGAGCPPPLACGPDDVCRASCAGGKTCLSDQRCLAGAVCAENAPVGVAGGSGGVAGATGTAGTTADAGTTGAAGGTGLAGMTADAGQSGATGAAGITGGAGITGAAGAGNAVQASLAKGCSLASQQAWLMADGKALFALCGFSYSSVPLDGSGAKTIVTPDSPFLVTLGSKYVAWMERYSLLAAPLTGEGGKTLALDALPSPGPLLAAGDGRIVYVAMPATGSNAPVMSVAPAGGTPQMLGVSPSRSVALSPDGARAYFLAPDFDLRTVPVDGSATSVGLGAVQIAGDLPHSLVFSPDGKRVAFLADDYSTNQQAPYSIKTFALDGSAPTQSATVDFEINPNLQKVLFSRDGAYVVAVARRAVASAPATGGASRVLGTGSAVRIVGIVGSAGTSALYVTRAGVAVTADLYLAPLAGTAAPTKLATLDQCAVLGSYLESIGVSPDGKRAVFTDAAGDLTLADLDAGTTTLLIASASGSSGICSLGPPRWTPDSSKVAYQRCRNNACVTAVITPTGDVVATFGTGSSTPRTWTFSPDSKRAIVENQVFAFGGPTVAYKGSIQFAGTSLAAPEPRPASYPWVDATRFVVQSPSGDLSLVTAP
jgi:hypothetical protein